MSSLTNINEKSKAHKTWRKEVKKTRRKRIRQAAAKVRNDEQMRREQSPTFLTKLAKERLLEEYELEELEKERKRQNEIWLRNEEIAQRLWREQERLKSLEDEERRKEQEKIREEYERRQEIIRKKKEEAEIARQVEEDRRVETERRINYFIENGGDIPAELEVIRETKPGRELCPFYSKVGACRFSSQCSRNHQNRFSNILIIPNFYTHFKLEQSGTEYDTDLHLEYDDTDMYLHFKEFYNDVVPEFRAQGSVQMVKVCCNVEAHLRGNVYVEYSTKREALIGFRAFQSRWYGGRQLNVDFVTIPDWGSAICGDYLRRKCPKGNACNFLHVFRNPGNEFPIDWNHKKTQQSARRESYNHRRPCRWSESPPRVRSTDSSERHSDKYKRQDKSERRYEKDKEKSKNRRRRDRS